MEISKALLDTLLAGAANVHAAMPVRPFPRPARRARAVSAAIGRFDRTPSTEVHSKRPLQLLRLLRTSRWRLVEVMPQYVYQPHNPHQPGSHRRSSSLPIFCTDAHGSHARTHSLQPAALWGRLLMNLPLPPQRTTRLPRPCRCLARGFRRDMPPPARSRARSTRPATRPLSAVRRCRHG